VLVTSLHQHEAPLADGGANGSWRVQISAGKSALRRTMRTAYEGQHSRPNSHASSKDGDSPWLWRGKVDRVSSNRHAELPNGTITFQRSSTTTNVAFAMPRGLIDPHQKRSIFGTIQAIAALSCYSVHAQIHFRTGRVTATSRPWHARFVSSKLRIRFRCMPPSVAAIPLWKIQRWRSSHYTILANDP